MSHFRVYSPFGDPVDQAIPVDHVTPVSTECLLEYGLGAVWVMRTFGAEFSEPHMRFAWQHRHTITRETYLADAFKSSVSLTGSDGRKIHLPWHPDTFTALYVLNLYIVGKHEEAEIIAAVTPPTDPVPQHIVEVIVTQIHRENESLADADADEYFDTWLLSEFPTIQDPRVSADDAANELGALPLPQPTPPPDSGQKPTLSQ